MISIRGCPAFPPSAPGQVRAREEKRADPSLIPSEGLMMQLMRALDTLVLLDSIKDTKACFNNDFATYKRAFQVSGYVGD